MRKLNKAILKQRMAVQLAAPLVPKPRRATLVCDPLTGLPTDSDHPWNGGPGTRKRPRKSRSWRGVNTRAWLKVRDERLRIEPRCRVCGAPATDADHVVPLKDGGALLDIENTQSLCAYHHSRKTADENERRR